MIYCEHCGEPKKEYVGFAGRAGDPNNPWDCVNKSCSPKTMKAPTVCGGSGYHVCYRSNRAYTICTTCGAEDSFSSLLTGCEAIPTQSAPAQSSAAQPATQASSQIQRRQGLNNAIGAVVTGAQSLSAPDLYRDDPDQCTLQLQESGLPPSLGTPKLQYGARGGKAAQMTHWFLEKTMTLESGQSAAFVSPHGTYILKKA